MKLIFYGGAGEVTGSLFYFETKKTKFLVDCGLYQEGQEIPKQNYKKFKFDPKKIDFVIITHSHLDHIGLLPKLYKEGFRGKIFAIEPTKELLKSILYDFIKISDECSYRKVCNYKEIDKIYDLVEPLKYYKDYKIEDIKFSFKNSGHILGSGFVILEFEGKRMLVTGDLGSLDKSSLHGPPDPPEEADYIITEAVYGGFVHKHKYDKLDVLEDEIEEVITKNGCLMIPSFALDRAQELLFDLNFLVENHKVPFIPIFLDSPLAIDITEIYKKFSNYFSDEVKSFIEKGDDFFNFPGLKITKTRDESIEINNVPKPKVIIAGSGMSNGGRILHHEVRYLPDEKSTLLIIGWQAKGTLGRELIEGKKEVKIFDKIVKVNAKIKILDGYSGHADQKDLLNFFSNLQTIPKKVFVAQAEKENAKKFSRLMMDKLGFDCLIPEKEKVYEL